MKLGRYLQLQIKRGEGPTKSAKLYGAQQPDNVQALINGVFRKKHSTEHPWHVCTNAEADSYQKQMRTNDRYYTDPV